MSLEEPHADNRHTKTDKYKIYFVFNDTTFKVTKVIVFIHR